MNNTDDVEPLSPEEIYFLVNGRPISRPPIDPEKKSWICDCPEGLIYRYEETECPHCHAKHWESPNYHGTEYLKRKHKKGRNKKLSTGT